jgi:hypothetical protein
MNLAAEECDATESALGLGCVKTRDALVARKNRFELTILATF